MRYMNFLGILFVLLLTISCETSHGDERINDVDTLKVDSVDHSRSDIREDEKKKSAMNNLTG